MEKNGHNMNLEMGSGHLSIHYFFPHGHLTEKKSDSKVTWWHEKPVKLPIELYVTEYEAFSVS